jgi:hypothetical protein
MARSTHYRERSRVFDPLPGAVQGVPNVGSKVTLSDGGATFTCVPGRWDVELRQRQCDGRICKRIWRA